MEGRAAFRPVVTHLSDSPRLPIKQVDAQAERDRRAVDRPRPRSSVDRVAFAAPLTFGRGSSKRVISDVSRMASSCRQRPPEGGAASPMPNNGRAFGQPIIPAGFIATGRSQRRGRSAALSQIQSIPQAHLGCSKAGTRAKANTAKRTKAGSTNHVGLVVSIIERENHTLYNAVFSFSPPPLVGR